MNRSLPAITFDGGLSSYLHEIKKFPMLEKEKEFMLAKRLVEHNDTKAAHILVTSHLRLVAKIALGYRFYGLPVSDLIAEGNIGLMRAVKKFDPDRGFRLATYAIWWIKASISEYVLKSWSLVKVGTVASQKKLFFNLKKLKSKLNIYSDNSLKDEEVGVIAETLNVDKNDVLEMNSRLSRPDSSLNVPISEDTEREAIDILVSKDMSQEDVYAQKQERQVGLSLLNKGFEVLNKRERHILEVRRLSDKPRTLEDLGLEYGISRERVRQIENRAFEKLKKAVFLASNEDKNKLNSHF